MKSGKIDLKNTLSTKIPYIKKTKCTLKSKQNLLNVTND